MNIIVKEAEFKDSEAFKMLWQFYQYHQSSFSFDDIDQKGRFDIDEVYLEDVLKGKEDCTAYLVLIEQVIAGFVTVESTEILDKEMPELSDIFILPKYRNRGIAKYVVEKLMLKNESNEWHVAIYRDDNQAFNFWQNLFDKLNLSEVKQVNSPQSEEFFEYVVKNSDKKG